VPFPGRHAARSWHSPPRLVEHGTAHLSWAARRHLCRGWGVTGDVDEAKPARCVRTQSERFPSHTAAAISGVRLPRGVAQ
jgi:hypothetical protein